MVGEIRDPETADDRRTRALTGHLVLSTLHANDAPSTLTRLSELGIEPYLSSSSLLGIVAQRLVRRLCPKCKRPQDIAPSALVDLGFNAEQAEMVRPMEAVGCESCRNTGYRGRIGIYEVMELSPALTKLRLEHAPSEAIREAAIAGGMRTMRQDGLDKVAAGITSLREVVRAAV